MLANITEEEFMLTERFSKILLIIGIVLIVFGPIFFMWNEADNLSLSGKIQADKFGQFGDVIGGFIGSIWSLAGVILFYVALTEQRGDFKINRKVLIKQAEALEQQIREFELQREELSETRKVFKIQSETLKLQQFESTFFNLLNLHHEIVNSIDLVSYEKKPANSIKELSEQMHYSGERIVTTGRDVFVKFRKGLENTYHKTVKMDSERDEYILTNIAYDKYYEKHQSDLGHYFRNLYHVFKFINNSDIKDKGRYASMVRAQLSNDELILLFYNSISAFGREKFKPLIEDYHLLKNMNIENLIRKDEHINFYSKSAYENVC